MVTYQNRVPAPPVTVTLRADVARARFGLAAAARAAADLAEAMETFRRTMARGPRAVRDLIRRYHPERLEVEVAGLGARYFVRGAMDTRYDSPVDRNTLVRDLMQGRELPGLTYAERGQVAADFIAGWVSQHDGPEPLRPYRRGSYMDRNTGAACWSCAGMKGRAPSPTCIYPDSHRA